ncbi:hypothetical protein QWZ00_05880 [Belliella kenyensis]|uniref:hypothetical protein n=1 Tax=Belliella kenyensis TaxID=1472724 RepID=UPI0025B4DC60|nr:hypothetical protein [Belliella kenyensis]MDN3602639.1 hypothetical protein [Belliella kenyensis]
MFILIYQTSLASKQFELEQKQQLASVMPYLQIFQGYSSEEDFVYLKNTGLGPAFIKHVRMKYNDEIFENMDYLGLYRKVKKEGNHPDLIIETNSVTEGMVISPNDILVLLKVYSLENEDAWTDVLFGKKVEMEIEFASIYDERWQVSGTFSVPVKVKDFED